MRNNLCSDSNNDVSMEKRNKGKHLDKLFVIVSLHDECGLSALYFEVHYSLMVYSLIQYGRSCDCWHRGCCCTWRIKGDPRGMKASLSSRCCSRTWCMLWFLTFLLFFYSHLTNVGQKSLGWPCHSVCGCKHSQTGAHVTVWRWEKKNRYMERSTCLITVRIVQMRSEWNVNASVQNAFRVAEVPVFVCFRWHRQATDSPSRSKVSAHCLLGGRLLMF